MRSKISDSPRTSSCAVGSSSSTTPAPSCTAHKRTRQRDALPLPARQIGAALVTAGEDGVERGEICGARRLERRADDLVRRPARRDVVAQRKLEA